MIISCLRPVVCKRSYVSCYTPYRSILLRNIPKRSVYNQIAPSTARQQAYSTNTKSSYRRALRQRQKWYLAVGVSATLAVGSFYLVEPFRHFVIAVKRCAVLGVAVVFNIVDYKLLFRKSWAGEDSQNADIVTAAKEQRHQDYSDTHTRCAKRILKALLINGGTYIKIGQHISSIQLIPLEWSSTMRPLQDNCDPTDMDRIAQLFRQETGATIEKTFSSFDPDPIGVASLAQVHRAVDRSGRQVAVKIMHPDLEEFAMIDVQTVSFALKFVKKVFLAFEFEWLGEEMRENLPLEMDFRHEAANARRCEANFAHFKSTPIVVPEILFDSKRVLIMEFIQGARVDDLDYLAKHNINRNTVSQELAKIFSQMLYLDGFFHADPHAGNLLIRPTQPNSRSPHNFEIALLDHGLYFDLPDKLRVGYSRFWLALISPASPKIEQDRRRFAKEFAGIDDDLYLVFQSAITGRASTEASGGARKFSMSEMGELSPEESKRIRQAVVADGLILDIFDILRRIPKRLLMVLKLNDLTRSLDNALQTTHGLQIWLITARYCALAAWHDDLARIQRDYRKNGFTLRILWTTMADFASWKRWQISLAVASSRDSSY